MVLEAVTSTFKDWLSLLLLGLGIQFSAHEFVGGLFLSFAGAAIARAWEKEHARKFGVDLPPESRTSLYLVVGTAFFVSTLVAALAYSHFPNWSMPMVMAAAGFASRKIAIGALVIVDGVAQRGDSIAQRIINKFLPDATIHPCEPPRGSHYQPRPDRPNPRHEQDQEEDQ